MGKRDSPKLRSRLLREGELQPKLRHPNIVAGILRGVRAAHEAGTIHRDLSRRMSCWRSSTAS